MTAKAGFYTYVHRKADTNEVFYVGKGKGQRSHTIYNRTKYWRHVVAKHGFVVEFVEFFDMEEDALSSEIAMIADYRSRGNSLVNLTIGGEGASGQVFTEDRKKKISEALKGKTVPDEVREKISQSLKGRKQPPRSDAHKRHLSESQKGRVFTDAHKNAIREAMSGIVIVFSEEARRKISEAGRGRIKSPETIEKLRIANLGKQHALGSKRTPESLAKMSLWQKGRKISADVLERRKTALIGKPRPNVSDEAKKRMSESGIARWAAHRAALAAQI